MSEFLMAAEVGAVVSINRVEVLARAVARRALEAAFEAWQSVVEQAAHAVGLACPGCGSARKCKTRPQDPMRVEVLGLVIELPKLYLECGHCGAPGVSITRLLTGLSSGDESAELKLAAGYCASQQSYGKASRDLKAHYGQEIERTSVRRMALAVEQDALAFVERQREHALHRVAQEQRTTGPERLMLQGDGGMVRTGTLVACERGDEGYNKKTAKTDRPRRKRDAQYREIITLDVREPGATESTALDVVVPVVAAQGERHRRMLALAARKGLGDNTQMIGLGDMGSKLAESFAEAFVGYNAFYSADWKHTSDYVYKAAEVLEGLDQRHWAKNMKDALWERDEKRRDKLLIRAGEHRLAKLPAHLDKCPLEALNTYVENNWVYLQAKRLKDLDIDFVSARAEAQVRDRTNDRFDVPGAWRQENLEGKATLRAIIAEGSWAAFRADAVSRQVAAFDAQLQARLKQAVAEKRIHAFDPTISLGAAVAAPIAEGRAAA